MKLKEKTRQSNVPAHHSEVAVLKKVNVGLILGYNYVCETVTFNLLYPENDNVQISLKRANTNRNH